MYFQYLLNQLYVTREVPLIISRNDKNGLFFYFSYLQVFKWANYENRGKTIGKLWLQVVHELKLLDAYHMMMNYKLNILRISLLACNSYPIVNCKSYHAPSVGNNC